MRFRAFRRLWIVLGFSSIGDWMGILATSTFASTLFDSPTAKGAAFGGTIAVRLIPALVLGPIAGVFADRYDRRRTMVICDSLRFLFYGSIPIVSHFASVAVAVAWIGIATFLIETCQMMWAPAKEASVPNLIPRARLEKANQLGMATTYGVTPILAGIVLAFINWAVGAVGFSSSYSVALFLNALTYAATALMVWFGIREISGHREHAPAERKRGMLRQFLDGWRYVARFPFARGLVLGILGAFAAAGAVIGSGRTYAKSLGGGDASFYLLFALLFVGLAIGITAGPRIVGQLSRRRWFGLSIILATGAVGLLAIAPHLFVAAILTVIVGAGAGMAFLNGITLLGAEIDDAMRGRVYSFIQVAVQGVLLLSLTVSSVLVGFGSSHRVSVGPVSVSISATRLLLFVAGVVGVFAGYAAFKQMDDKRGVPLLADIWSSMRGRPLGRPETGRGSGVFVVFEGGEGAGKSTQVIKLAAWLRVRGREAVVTREPGATEVGARIRGLVLDKNALPGDARVSPRAEALLYAADRAHHVATVVRPALLRGAVVVSDRYVDSSLAYQGAGRTLPVEEIGWLSDWATGGLKPDLVVLLDVDPTVGLSRVADRGAADRLESESILFHERVRTAFLDLAAGDPSRYLVLDGTQDPDRIAAAVRRKVAALLPPDHSLLTPELAAEPPAGPPGWPGDAEPPAHAAPGGTDIPDPAVGPGAAVTTAPDEAPTDEAPTDEAPTDSAPGGLTDNGPAGRESDLDTGASGPESAAAGPAARVDQPTGGPVPDPAATGSADVRSGGAGAAAASRVPAEPSRSPAPEKPHPSGRAEEARHTEPAGSDHRAPAQDRTEETETPVPAGAADDQTHVLPRVSEKPDGDEGRAGETEPRTRVLPRVSGESDGADSPVVETEPRTRVLPTVPAESDDAQEPTAEDEPRTRVLPRVPDGRGRSAPASRKGRRAGKRDDAPAKAPLDATTVMPAVSDQPGDTPADPWAETGSTAVFPTVEEHAVRETYDDDETMIMPSSTGDIRRRRPRRKR